MADPTINLATPVEWKTTGVILDTTSTENVLANKAASGVLIEVYSIVGLSADASNPTTLVGWVYNQDGTGISSNTGRYEASTSTDTVAGSAIFYVVPAGSAITEAAGQVFVDEGESFFLHEDQSLVFQAGAANDASVRVSYRILGPDPS